MSEKDMDALLDVREVMEYLSALEQNRDYGAIVQCKHQALKSLGVYCHAARRDELIMPILDELASYFGLKTREEVDI